MAEVWVLILCTICVLMGIVIALDDIGGATLIGLICALMAGAWL